MELVWGFKKSILEINKPIKLQNVTWKLSCRGFDDEMRAVVARNLEGRGINMHPRTTLTEVVKFCWLCKPVRL